MMEKTSLTLKNRFKHFLLNVFMGGKKLKNEIIFESFPDFSCNSYVLYLKMKEMGWDKKYILTWLLHDKTSAEEYKDICSSFIFIDCSSTIEKLKAYKRKFHSKIIISSNLIIPKITGPKEQIHIYLDHGSQLKNMKIDGKRIDLDCDYFVSQAKFFNPYNIDQYVLKDEQIITTGLPRYDLLKGHYSTIDRLIPNATHYKKIIIWLPTFRKHFNGIRVDCDFDFPYGVPLLMNEDILNSLNDNLRRNEVLLILKPHPAQDISRLTSLNLSNLKVLYSKDLKEKKIQLDELLTQTDAMISDYSSIYYDYLLLNKPIGITLDDYKDYENQKGFVFANISDFIKGDPIYDWKDLLKFIENVVNGIDLYKEERKTISKIINEYNDSNNSARLIKEIEKILAERFK